ncbi:MAG: hypothetical protein QXH78_02920 [Desulfurococcaceae archaeon]
MPKFIIYIKPKFEEYDVKIYMYDGEGRLVSEKEYSSIKQLVVKSQEVRLSRQMFHEYLALIVEASSPRIEVKENGLLYIHG